MIHKIVDYYDVIQLFKKEFPRYTLALNTLLDKENSIRELSEKEVNNYFKDKQHGGKCYCFSEEAYYTPDNYGNHYVRKEYKCLGTREKETCTCMGDRDKCDFYK